MLKTSAVLALILMLGGCATMAPHPFAVCESQGDGEWSELPKPPADASQLRALVKPWNVAEWPPSTETWSGREDGWLQLCQPWMTGTELETPSGVQEVTVVGKHCTEFCRQ